MNEKRIKYMLDMVNDDMEKYHQENPVRSKELELNSRNNHLDNIRKKDNQNEREAIKYQRQRNILQRQRLYNERQNQRIRDTHS